MQTRQRGRQKAISLSRIEATLAKVDTAVTPQFWLPVKPGEKVAQKRIGNAIVNIVAPWDIPDSKGLPEHIKAPQPKQIKFLECDADIAIYGGSAGSGKSWASLLDPIRYLDNPKFRGVIIRKSGADLRNPGGLVDASHEVYPQLGGTYSVQSMDWRFPAGSRLGFRHCEHENDIYNFLGAELGYISFDELALLADKVFWFLLSRNRSTSGIKPVVRATCNPDAESFVADLLNWWIDPIDGYALLKRSGVVRHFVRISGDLHWADQPQELRDRFGEDAIPKSFTFIPATIYDNQKLLDVDPGYLANLKAQHPVDQERFLGDRERGGNWKIKLEAGLVFDRSWFQVTDHVPGTGIEYRFWDLAATAREVAKQSSFYTCGVKLKKVGSDYYVLDCHYVQVSPAKVADIIFAIANQDTTHTMIRWELEGGSAGKIVESTLKEKLKDWNARAIKPKGDKVSRAIPAATAANQGRVFLVRAPWNDAFLSAMQNFDGTPKPLVNDIVDAFDGAFDCANRGSSQQFGFGSK